MEIIKERLQFLAGIIKEYQEPPSDGFYGKKKVVAIDDQENTINGQEPLDFALNDIKVGDSIYGKRISDSDMTEKAIAYAKEKRAFKGKGEALANTFISIRYKIIEKGNGKMVLQVEKEPIQ
jgi:hypothetical protein